MLRWTVGIVLTSTIALATASGRLDRTEMGDPPASEPPPLSLSIPTGGSRAVASFFSLDRYIENVRSIASFGDRDANGNSAAFLQKNTDAGDWIEQELMSYGYTVTRHAFTQGGWTSPRDSFYVTKVGKTSPHQMYIVSAHMDGRGGGQAANDDGSGTALVLELARAFAEPGVETDVSIRFALWNNEETGLDGATAYRNDRQALQGIESPPGSGLFPEPTWLGIIQHDMMMWDHGFPPGENQSPTADVDIEFQASSTMAAQSQALANLLAAGNVSYSTTHPAEVTNNMCCTDSVPFQNVIPAVSLRENRRAAETGQGANPTYHNITDVFEFFSLDDFKLGFSALETTGGTVAELTGAGFGDAGVIVLDRDVYNCSDTIAIEVRDGGLEGAGSVMLTFTTTGGDSETITLTEDPAGTGRMRGSIATGGGAPTPSSGLLEVDEGETITATYNDADDGTMNPAVVQKTAGVDCTPPAFAGVDNLVASDEQIVVNWLAADDVNGPIRYNIYRATSPGAQDFMAPLATTKALTYTDATALNGVTYYYVVRAEDRGGAEDGNTVELNDRALGAVHHFTFAPIGPQQAGAPFQVTVTARFKGGAIADTFSGTTGLRGFIGDPSTRVVISEFDSGVPDIIEFTNVSGHSIDLSGWRVAVMAGFGSPQTGQDPRPWVTGGSTGGWRFIFPQGAIGQAGDVFTLDENNSAFPGSYPGFSANFNINWSTGDPAASIFLLDENDDFIDFVSTRPGSATIFPKAPPPSEWTGGGISVAPPDTQLFIRVGSQDNNDATDWTRGAGSIGSLNPGLASNFTTPVSMSPAMTGNFVNGVWTGMATVNVAMNDVRLGVDNFAGAHGASDPFDVFSPPAAALRWEWYRW